MKRVSVKNAALLLLFLLATLSFNACETEDEMAEYALMGQWRIVEVNFTYGDYCPYRSGDYVIFYEDRTAEFYGRNGFHEYATWRIIDTGYGHELHISFDDYSTDIVADMSSFTGDYVRLDVSDYYYNSRYTLRLTRR